MPSAVETSNSTVPTSRGTGIAEPRPIALRSLEDTPARAASSSFNGEMSDTASFMVRTSPAAAAFTNSARACWASEAPSSPSGTTNVTPATATANASTIVTAENTRANRQRAALGAGRISSCEPSTHILLRTARDRGAAAHSGSSGPTARMPDVGSARSFRADASLQPSAALVPLGFGTPAIFVTIRGRVTCPDPSAPESTVAATEVRDSGTMPGSVGSSSASVGGESAACRSTPSTAGRDTCVSPVLLEGIRSVNDFRLLDPTRCGRCGSTLTSRSIASRWTALGSILGAADEPSAPRTFVGTAYGTEGMRRGMARLFGVSAPAYVSACGRHARGRGEPEFLWFAVHPVARPSYLQDGLVRGAHSGWRKRTTRPRGLYTGSPIAWNCRCSRPERSFQLSPREITTARQLVTHTAEKAAARMARQKPTRPPSSAVTIAIVTGFLLVHQVDKFLVAPLATPIMEEFGIGEDKMGLTATAAILVGLVLLPLWGYLGDRLSRPRVVAAASGIWGATTLLTAVAPNYGSFLAARASTGIDDDAYPAVRSLVADYVRPYRRAAIYGLLAATAPIGYLTAVVLAVALRDAVGWRGLYVITGVAGIAFVALVLAGAKEVPRGSADRRALGIASQSEEARFSWSHLRWLSKRPTFWVLVAQGFFGVFPWNVIGFWFFRYLEVERGLSEGRVLAVMACTIVAMSAGNLAGGSLGDAFVRKREWGRIAVATVAVLAGAGLLWTTLLVPRESFWAFVAMASLTAFVIPIPGPNVLATLMDISPAGVRSTAAAVQNVMEGSGASLAPFLAGVVAVRSDLQTAIGVTSVAAWTVCGILFTLAFRTVGKDTSSARRMAAAEYETQAEGLAGRQDFPSLATGGSSR